MWLVFLACSSADRDAPIFAEEARPTPAAPSGAASPSGPAAPPTAQPGADGVQTGPDPRIFGTPIKHAPIPPMPPPPPGPWPEGEGTCPADMAKVPGRNGPFCIHRYEVAFRGQPGNFDQGVKFPDGSTQGQLVSSAGVEPTTAVSWYQSYAACQQAGVHLCTAIEWTDACAGPQGRAYATVDGTYHRGICGTGQGLAASQSHPKGGGSWPECHTPEGVYDLLGNAWEWADPGLRDEDGVPMTDKHGGALYTYDPAGCGFTATGVDRPIMTGTVGFRCCTAVKP